VKNSSTVFAHALTNLATNSLMASACEVAGPWANLTLKSSKTATLHPTIPLNGHHSLPASSDGNGGTAMRENTLPTGVGTVVDTIAIDTATMNYSAATFAAFASPTGFMALTVKRACVPSFARGTAIRVPDGEQAAEALAIGDLVETRDGARPVKWIGRRAYAGRFADANPAILPVCIKAGAMADGVPHRDLTVSPQHAVLIDGVMVAAIHLVNGVSVVQAERVDAIEYLHIELEQHNAIWAEGALSETFADADSRATFHNVHEYATLYGTEPGSWPGASPSLCAPRLGSRKTTCSDPRVASSTWWSPTTCRAGRRTSVTPRCRSASTCSSTAKSSHRRWRMAHGPTWRALASAAAGTASTSHCRRSPRARRGRSPCDGPRTALSCSVRA